MLIHSLAADVVESRLDSARKMGAQVTINCSKESLKDVGMYFYDYKQLAKQLVFCIKQ